MHATQPQVLIDFYSALLGWSFEKFGPMDYWIIKTGPDGQPRINGGLVPRRGAAPAHGAAVALPKMAIPGMGWLAYILDPDGNILGLMQPDTAAA